MMTESGSNNTSSLTEQGTEEDTKCNTVASNIPIPQIKQIKEELDISFTECTPSAYSPTTTVMHEIDFGRYCEQRDRSPSSPDRQHCSSTTQPIEEHSRAGHTTDGIKEEDSPRRLCLVCGDVASGFHYGVASCEACKAFFKRTIQGNIEYTCPAVGECEINKRRRKACQACRFRKCLRCGMLKEGVRLDRVRGGRQKYRRNPDLSFQMLVTTAQRPQMLEDIKMLEALKNCEPDMLEINVSLEVSKHRTLSMLSDLYDRELVGIIGWAKQIPGFTDLSLNDEMRLLQSTWAEILTLTLAYRSMKLLASGKLRYATDFTLDEKQARECGAHELYNRCCHVVERLERLSICKEEYFLLKALVLANSDVRLDDYHALKKFRESILGALSDAVGILRPSGALLQLQHLLLSMPALRQADYAVRRFWSDIHQRNLVPMNKLFLEMLESYSR
ncbi:steroid hormone receptor ERR2 isoform X2 [Chrysoperla carnea]|nr:steroid hormone receptor ERR2 isoform X2 [Chrysoperla carnea]